MDTPSTPLSMNAAIADQRIEDQETKRAVRFWNLLLRKRTVEQLDCYIDTENLVLVTQNLSDQMYVGCGRQVPC